MPYRRLEGRGEEEFERVGPEGVSLTTFSCGGSYGCTHRDRDKIPYDPSKQTALITAKIIEGYKAKEGR